MTPESFFAKFAPMCVTAAKRNGGFCSTRLAQIALESNWGEATPKDIDSGRESFNLTGVKGRGPAGSVRAWTWEVVGGKDVKVIAEFRAYNSFEEHIVERDRIFEWSNYDAYRAAQTPEDAVRGLVEAPMPYATDPAYGSKLLALVEKYDLKRFDGPFRDVRWNAWYADDLAEMKAKGYVKGDSNGNLAMSEESVRLLVIINRVRKDLTK